MNIGIRMHDTVTAPIIQRIQNLNKAGFNCTQLALKKAVIDLPVENDNLTPGLGSYFKRAFDENKVDIAVLGCYLNLANPNQETMKVILETYKVSLQFAKYVGAYMVGTETGAVNEAYQYEVANHSEEALKIFIDNLRIVVAYAEKLGVTVGIEPVYQHIVYDMERAMKVIKAIDSPNLQLIFDPVNLLSLDNYTREDEVVREAIACAGPYIGAIHLKDYKVENGAFSYMGAGLGQFKFDYLMHWIKESKPEIHILLEDTQPDNADEVKKFIQSFQ